MRCRRAALERMKNGHSNERRAMQYWGVEVEDFPGSQRKMFYDVLTEAVLHLVGMMR